MKKKFLPLLLTLVLSKTNAANIPYVQIHGSLPVLIPLNSTASSSATSPAKYIMLEKITLSSQAKQDIATRLQQNAAMTLNNSANNTQIDLGMNDVPVLDQGMHGTCVTFAATAAIDALNFHSDYISQLCNLELGQYLHLQDDTYPSGWEGSQGAVVLEQIQKYGIIGNAYQTQQGCAGINRYPLSDPNDMGKPMSGSLFKHVSEDIMKTVSWDKLFDRSEQSNISDNQTVELVKKSIASGNRVIFGTLLDTHMGAVGAIGTTKVKNDRWMVTPALIADVDKYWLLAGHEMIIEGYDDSMTIIGSNNQKERGAFILRNSWGTDAGDQGNYYMSYNYFKKFALDADAISPLK